MEAFITKTSGKSSSSEIQLFQISIKRCCTYLSKVFNVST